MPHRRQRLPLPCSAPEACGGAEVLVTSASQEVEEVAKDSVRTKGELPRQLRDAVPQPELGVEALHGPEQLVLLAATAHDVQAAPDHGGRGKGSGVHHRRQDRPSPGRGGEALQRAQRALVQAHTSPLSATSRCIQVGGPHASCNVEVLPNDCDGRESPGPGHVRQALPPSLREVEALRQTHRRHLVTPPGDVEATVHYGTGGVRAGLREGRQLVP
mmetsp:Transcript_109236/g.340424  ORF Transcript_109236/g.340424 Transcript_109236/m.340424 type:complete len:216 (+) Transcript_109236:578-1225(+)